MIVLGIADVLHIATVASGWSCVISVNRLNDSVVFIKQRKHTFFQFSLIMQNQFLQVVCLNRDTLYL